MKTSFITILFFLFSTILVSNSYGTPKCDESGLSNALFNISTSSEECSNICTILKDTIEGKECTHSGRSSRMGPDWDIEGKIFESKKFACIESWKDLFPNDKKQACYKISEERKQTCLFNREEISFSHQLIRVYKPRVSNEDLKQVTNFCPAQKINFPPFNNNVVMFGVHYNEVDVPNPAYNISEQTKLIICVQHEDLYYDCNEFGKISE